MRIGKLSNRDLQRLVLDRLPKSHRFVTSGPAVGQDCSAIRFGDGQVVLSTDPITGASSDIGRLAVIGECQRHCYLRNSADGPAAHHYRPAGLHDRRVSAW
jgi:hydrogenase maturation factor